jgi:transcriptional regulator with XRE-family HTH domain
MEPVYKRLGKRVKMLREGLGLTQEKLAARMGLSRVSISNIESGSRKINADELLRLSRVLNIHVDALLDPKRQPEVIFEKPKGAKEDRVKLRISVPQKNLEKFREVLLYVLSEVGSRPNVGETVIYKLLYFIDFDFYEQYEEQLIGATYIKNHYGPTPIEFKKIVDMMIADNELERIEGRYFDFPQTKYLPLRKANLSKLRADEFEVINRVLNRLSNMNAAEISRYSHNDVPWLTTEEGEAINYEASFYRTSPYSVRDYGEEDI